MSRKGAELLLLFSISVFPAAVRPAALPNRKGIFVMHLFWKVTLQKSVLQQRCWREPAWPASILPPPPQPPRLAASTVSAAPLTSQSRSHVNQRNNTMKLSPAFAASALVLVGLAAAPAAHAQLLFTLTPAGLAGTPGSTLQYAGTLSNTSTTDTVFLNGDSPTLNAPGLTLDAGPFEGNAPLSLGPVGSGSDIYSGGFFDISIDPAAQPGTYVGTFAIQGGADGDAQDTVATHDFSVTVLPAAVPEASSVVSLGLLLMLGLGGVVVARRKTAQHV